MFRLISHRWWLLALSVLCATLVALLALARDMDRRASRTREGGESRPELTDLVAAVGRSRPFSPRLTGGFLYSPPPTARRGSGGSTRTAPTVAIAVARLEQALDTDDTPRAYAAFGAGRLLAGDADGAIQALERSVQDIPDRASWWSDLAAAYLVRGSRQARQEDMARALDAALRAHALSPTLTEARYNVALALEANALFNQAAEEWRRYTQFEPDREWRMDAELRLRDSRAAAREDWMDVRARLLDVRQTTTALDLQRAAASFAQGVRELIEDDLLPSWAEAGSTADATALLSRATALAQALHANGGDGLPRDACRILAGLSGTTRDRAARGLVAFRSARRSFARADHVPAIAQFLQAERDLAAAGVPLWGWAVAHRAASERAQHEVASAVRTAKRAAEFARMHGYAALGARASWTTGVAYAELGDPVAAYRFARAAMTGFEQVREIEHAGAVASTAADMARRIGDRRQSWTLLRKALETAETERVPVRRYLRYYNASLFARHDGLLHAAHAYQEQAVVAARDCPPDNGALAQALTQRAAISVLLREPERAERDLAQARAALSAAHGGIAVYMRAELELVEASVLIDRHPDAAREKLASASATLGRATPGRLPEMHLALARVLLRDGRDVEALRELQAGLSFYDSRRLAIADDNLRLGFFDTARELYGELVGVALRRGDVDGAFTYSDRARGRSLLDEPGGRATAAPAIELRTLPAARARIPDHVAFIEYSLAGPRPVAWILTRARVVVVPLSLEPNRVARGTRELREPRTADRANTAALTLHDWILSPLRDRLDGVTSLVISADGVLHTVPFAALIDRRTGRRVVEDFAISLVPSLVSYLDASERWTRRAVAAPVSLLAIGNPKFDRAELRDLPDLPDAEAEARAIAAHYPRPELLLSRDATARKFRARADLADVIHFGGHALANPDAPDLSFLALAPEADGSGGRLFASEIARFGLERPRLVVLAACSTADGPFVFGEGVLHLARPFLMAGVPAVVATLWDVDDRATSRLVEALHREVSRGSDVARALQLVQIARLRSADPRESDWRTWAPFVAIGGTSRSSGRSPLSEGEKSDGS